LVRAGFPATVSREPRQARKGAAAAVTPGAGEGLARAFREKIWFVDSVALVTLVDLAGNRPSQTKR